MSYTLKLANEQNGGCPIEMASHWWKPHDTSMTVKIGCLDSHVGDDHSIDLSGVCFRSPSPNNSLPNLTAVSCTICTGL
jgi:hypothetical protein